MNAYTHIDHFNACKAASQRGEVLQAWVQVKTHKTSLCGRILEPWTASNGVQFWKVQVSHPLPHIGHYPVGVVRACSGLDGLCTCVGVSGSVLMASGLKERERDNSYSLDS